MLLDTGSDFNAFFSVLWSERIFREAAVVYEVQHRPVELWRRLVLDLHELG